MYDTIRIEQQKQQWFEIDSKGKGHLNHFEEIFNIWLIATAHTDMPRFGSPFMKNDNNNMYLLLSVIHSNNNNNNFEL